MLNDYELDSWSLIVDTNRKVNKMKNFIDGSFFKFMINILPCFLVALICSIFVKEEFIHNNTNIWFLFLLVSTCLAVSIDNNVQIRKLQDRT